MEKTLQDRAVWVTGAARGIGKGIADELASRGARLMLTDVLADELAITAAAIAAAHQTAVIHDRLDVTDGEGAERVVQRCVTELGGLHGLINNAGITRDALLLRMSIDDWNRVLTVNLTGTFVCTRAAIKAMMKARYGKIVNIASVVGLTGNPGQANYAASKAGMVAFTKSVARELGGRGIRANAVAPGFIQTEMTDKLPPEVREAYLKGIPLNYFGGTQDVARVCAFLVSADSDYISGQVLVVDGGLHT